MSFTRMNMSSLVEMPAAPSMRGDRAFGPPSTTAGASGVGQLPASTNALLARHAQPPQLQPRRPLCAVDTPRSAPGNAPYNPLGMQQPQHTDGYTTPGDSGATFKPRLPPPPPPQYQNISTLDYYSYSNGNNNNYFAPPPPNSALASQTVGNIVAGGSAQLHSGIGRNFGSNALQHAPGYATIGAQLTPTSLKAGNCSSSGVYDGEVPCSSFGGQPSVPTSHLPTGTKVDTDAAVKSHQNGIQSSPAASGGATGRPRRKSVVQRHASTRRDENGAVLAVSNSLSAHPRTRGEKATETFCPVCDKKYKNQICLQKHAWEHHRSWDYAKKLMLTKHQSVQIMEAAQALVNLFASASSASCMMSLSSSASESASPSPASPPASSSLPASSVHAAMICKPPLSGATPRLAGEAYNSDDEVDYENRSASVTSSNSGGSSSDMVAGSPCYSDSVDVEA